MDNLLELIESSQEKFSEKTYAAEILDEAEICLKTGKKDI